MNFNKNIFIKKDGTVLEYSDMNFEECMYFSWNEEKIIERITGKKIFELFLSTSEWQLFLKQIFSEIFWKNDGKNSSDSEDMDYDFIIAILMHYYHQDFSKILKMPAKKVFSLISKLPKILGTENHEKEKMMSKNELKKLF